MKKYFFKNKGTVLLTAIIFLLNAVMIFFLTKILEYISAIAVHGDLTQIKKSLLLIVAFFVADVSVAFLYSWARNNYRKVMTSSVMKDVLKKIIYMTPERFNQKNTGDYSSIIINDIPMIEENYFLPVILNVSAVFDLIMGIAYILSVNWILIPVILLLCIITLLIPKLLSNLLNKATLDYSQYAEKFTSFLKDIFQNYSVINGYQVQENYNKKTSEQIEIYQKKIYKKNWALSLSGNLSNTSTIFCQIVLDLILAYFVIINKMDVLYMIPVITAAQMFINPIYTFAENYGRITSIKAINLKLLNLLDYEELKDKKKKFEYIKLKDVFYTSEGKNILCGVSFIFEKEKKYCILGESGSGKSTILKIINGSYPCFEGEVQGISNDNIVSIEQKNLVFSDTIRNNITLYDSFTPKEIKKAMSFANIENMHLDDYINEEGKNYSGGEIERISIARAYLHQKEVLICDEITSDLDHDNALTIEKNILNLPATVLYVTHKYFKETLSMFDTILWIENGKIRCVGTLEEIKEKDPDIYRLIEKNMID